jgi:hypothetical protein
MESVVRYVDVFISHKKEDEAKALALKQQIIDWNFSCYIDAEDVELQKIKNAPDSDPRALGTATDWALQSRRRPAGHQREPRCRS